MVDMDVFVAGGAGVFGLPAGADLRIRHVGRSEICLQKPLCNDRGVGPKRTLGI